MQRKQRYLSKKFQSSCSLLNFTRICRILHRHYGSKSKEANSPLPLQYPARLSILVISISMEMKANFLKHGIPQMERFMERGSSSDVSLTLPPYVDLLLFPSHRIKEAVFFTMKYKNCFNCVHFCSRKTKLQFQASSSCPISVISSTPILTICVLCRS